MEKSFPFNANLVGGVPDRVYSAEDFAAERASYITNGVLTSDSLTVGAAGAMAVSVGSGVAVIDGYNYRNTDYLVFQLSKASELLSRIDTVVLVLDIGERVMRLAIKEGEYSSSPVSPALENGAEYKEMPIADIFVNAGASSVTFGDITDRRIFAKHLPAGNDITVRREVARFVSAGKYSFDTSGDNAVGGRYDIELCAGGGGGGSSPYATSCGGGGGAGAYVSVGVTLLQDKVYDVEVGAGGLGGEYGKPGGDGGDSFFGGFVARGGSGGESGNASNPGLGGSGGISGIFEAQSGFSGGISVNASSTEYQNMGRGADGIYGGGGESVFASSFPQSSAGRAGSAAGAGGSGGGGTQSGSVGGAGCDGFVIIYGYYSV